MKYIFLLLLLSPFLSHAQRIRTDEVDKFTKEKRIETKWFYIKGSGTPAMASAARIGKHIFLKLSISRSRPFGTVEGDPCLLLLKGVDEPVRLESYYTDAATYSNHWYLHFYYELNNDQLNKVLNADITDIRISLSDQSYVDINRLNKGKSDKIKSALEMVIGKGNIKMQ